jgi:hypothetical protein
VAGGPNAYMKSGARKSARGGRSLLAGLLRCRRCGHTLQVCSAAATARVQSFGACVAITRRGARRACRAAASVSKAPSANGFSRPWSGRTKRYTDAEAILRQNEVVALERAVILLAASARMPGEFAAAGAQ